MRKSSHVIMLSLKTTSPYFTPYYSLSNGCEMVWNFFATCHGYGEVDGVGALLKREVRKEKIKP